MRLEGTRMQGQAAAEEELDQKGMERPTEGGEGQHTEPVPTAANMLADVGPGKLVQQNAECLTMGAHTERRNQWYGGTRRSGVHPGPRAPNVP